MTDTEFSMLMPHMNSKESVERAEWIQQQTARLQNRGITWSAHRIGERSLVVMLKERDGWETLGIAYTQTPELFDLLLGVRYALEDALTKFGSGRWYDRGPSSAMIAECAMPRNKRETSGVSF